MTCRKFFEAVKKMSKTYIHTHIHTHTLTQGSYSIYKWRVENGGKEGGNGEETSLEENGGKGEKPKHERKARTRIL